MPVLDTPGLDTPGLDTLAWDIMAVDTTWVRGKTPDTPGPENIILVLLILIVGSTAFKPFWRDADDDGNRVPNTTIIRKSRSGCLTETDIQFYGNDLNN